MPEKEEQEDEQDGGAVQGFTPAVIDEIEYERPKWGGAESSSPPVAAAASGGERR